MAFQYSEAVPWGRSFEEYQRMFALTEQDLRKRILGCGDGPASFNAVLAGLGGNVVSCDPLYQLNVHQIEKRITETYADIMAQTLKNLDRFMWTQISSPDELGRLRMSAMKEFLRDYDQGKREGRYLSAELPELPFEDGSFDIAVCSHFLFLYTDNLSLEFHERAIAEMCRVAKDVRVFPLLNYNGERSPYVDPILRLFAGTVQPVAYEFQRGGNQLLKIETSRPMAKDM